MSACNTLQTTETPKEPERDDLSTLYKKAQNSSFPESEGYRLDAAQLLLAQGDRDGAQEILLGIYADALPKPLAARYGVVSAQSSLQIYDAANALTLLKRYSLDKELLIDPELQLQANRLAAEAYQQLGDAVSAAQALADASPMVPLLDRPQHQAQIWRSLMEADALLINQARQNADPLSEWSGWLALATLIKNNEFDLDSQLAELFAWQQLWPNHPAGQPLPQELQLLKSMVENRPKRVSLLLPLSGPNAVAGQAVQDGFMAAYFAALKKGYPVPTVDIVNTQSVGSFLEHYDQAVMTGAEVIVGPLEKSAVQALQDNPPLIPTLALNYGREAPPTNNLYQFGLAPEDEVRQVAELAWQAGHRNAVVLAPDSAWGRRIEQAFNQAWGERSGTLLETQFFTNQQSYSEAIKRLFDLDNSEERAAQMRSILRESPDFTPRRRQDVDFIFLLATPKQARQIVPTFAFHFAADIPVFATSHIYSGTPRPLLDRDLDGVIFTETPWLISGRKNAIYRDISSAWPTQSARLGRLYAMGVDAFRLLPRVPYFAELESLTVKGSTGTLSLGDNGAIVRTLPWVHIKRGKITPLPTSSSSRSGG